MKSPLTPEQEIITAVDDVKVALLADLKAKEKIIEVNREKTKTHYNLLKAKQRLSTLELSLN